MKRISYSYTIYIFVVTRTGVVADSTAPMVHDKSAQQLQKSELILTGVCLENGNRIIIQLHTNLLARLGLMSTRQYNG